MAVHRVRYGATQSADRVADLDSLAGKQARRFAEIAQRLADRADGLAERVVVNFVTVPEFIEQLVAADEPFAVFDQVGEHLKRPFRQMDLAAAGRQDLRFGIQNKLVENKTLGPFSVH